MFHCHMDFISNIEVLQKEDYYHQFLRVLEQLTVVNYQNITYEQFCLQLDCMNKNNKTVFVIKNDNKEVIATGSIFIEDKFIHQLGRVGHIEDVVVDEQYRKNKLGSKIINHLVQFGIKNNCYKIILNCSEKNKEFYTKCGFSHKNIEMSLYV
jgi:glucosamine-phosphate N-acetyltransferase